MNRSKWSGIPQGARHERFSGMQDSRLVIHKPGVFWDDIYPPATHDTVSQAANEADSAAIGMWEIDLDTLPDLTQHPHPQAIEVLDAIIRISCSKELFTGCSPTTAELPSSAPQSVGTGVE